MHVTIDGPTTREEAVCSLILIDRTLHCGYSPAHGGGGWCRPGSSSVDYIMSLDRVPVLPHHTFGMCRMKCNA